MFSLARELNDIKLAEELFANNRFPVDELVHETFLQLQKDLQTENIEIEFSGDMADPYQELSGKLQLILDGLFRSPEKLFRLLYRMDIPQGTFTEIIDQPEPKPALAHVFLKRSMEKVLFRKLNSGLH